MRLGLFGGSFDPPHNGHVAVAEAALRGFALDRILFAPTGRQPLKPEWPMASFEDRCAMVSALTETHPGFQLSMADAPHPDGTPNFTVDLITQLGGEMKPSDRLFNIVGADAFAGLPKWHEPVRLLESCEWIVVSRPGLDPREAIRAAIAKLGLTQVPAGIHALADVAEAVSATEVRKRLATGLSCSELVPEPVLRYIQRHRLYS